MVGDHTGILRAVVFCFYWTIVQEFQLQRTWNALTRYMPVCGDFHLAASVLIEQLSRINKAYVSIMQVFLQGLDKQTGSARGRGQGHG